jgi:hypothetical protein
VTKIEIKNSCQREALTRTEMLIQKYTPKSIVIRGDTKPYLEKIKSINAGKWGAGKFGYYGGEPGWMFHINQEQLVRDTLDIRTPYCDGPGPKSSSDSPFPAPPSSRFYECFSQ